MGWNDTWHERKRERSISYWRNHEVKLQACTACSGSGYYDSFGSPACASCDGTWRTRMALNNAESAEPSIQSVERRWRNPIEVRGAIKEARTLVLDVVPVLVPQGQSR